MSLWTITSLRVGELYLPEDGGVMPFGSALDRWLRPAQAPAAPGADHLHAGALATPTLALSCAARQALRQADVVETMLQGMLPVAHRSAGRPPRDSAPARSGRSHRAARPL